MERIEDLIHKLTAQYAAGEPPAGLLATVQQLQALLIKKMPAPEPVGNKKVSVVLPAGFVSKKAIKPTIAEEKTIEEPQVPVITETVAESPATEKPAPPVKEAVSAPEPYMLRRPAVTEVSVPPTTNPAFNLVEKVPTLRQTPQKELHELLGEKSESLNDRLKQEKTELGQALKSEPIKDLRKGIGVNDKFLFINELFRGDEAAYERSIKTINSFHILPEAEYWINRELKVKLGWTDTKDTVQHFYELVRRRFS